MELQKMELQNFKHKGKPRFGTPRYWWDYHWENGDIKEIHIVSDRKDLPIVVKLCLPDKRSTDNHIDFAQRIMLELNEGRLTL